MLLLEPAEAFSSSSAFIGIKGLGPHGLVPPTSFRVVNAPSRMLTPRPMAHIFTFVNPPGRIAQPTTRSARSTTFRLVNYG
jgi:hypothetical protein